MSTTSTTREKVTISARVRPGILSDIEELKHRTNLARKTADQKPLKTQSQMVEWLLGFAIEEVREQVSNPEPRKDHPKLPRSEYGSRAAGLMEALGDVLARIERHDPDGAVLLARGVAVSTTAYSNDLAKRYK